MMADERAFCVLIGGRQLFYMAENEALAAFWAIVHGLQSGGDTLRARPYADALLSYVTDHGEWLRVGRTDSLLTLHV